MIALLTPLLYVLGPLGLLLVAAVIFAETGLLAGFFLPGDSLLFVTGLLVAAGVLPLPLVLVLPILVAAAAAGDQVGFALGRRLGPKVFAREDSRFFSPRHLQSAQRFVTKHGTKAVILARFVPLARTFVPVVAGVGSMNYRLFATYNLVGAAAWVGLLTVAGFFLGGIPLIAAHVELITIGIVAFSMVPAGAALLRQRLVARHASSASAASSVVIGIDPPETLVPVG